MTSPLFDTPDPDVGLRVVAGIFKTLMIDREWSVIEPRGFRWIGWRLGQLVYASEPFEDVGMSVARVCATSVAVRNIQADDRQVAHEVLMLNRVATGSAWMFDRDTRTLWVGYAMTVHDQTAGFREQQLANCAILQLIDAEDRADDMAQRLSGNVAVVDHPESGRRDKADGMLALSSVIAERSVSRSVFAELEEMQSVYEFAKATNGGAFSASASPEGVCVEVPFGADDTALIEVITTSPHPSLGNGLLVLSSVRGAGTLVEALSSADHLNEVAFAPRSVFPLLGAWSAWEVSDTVWSLAFSTFVPNLMATRGVALDAASSAVFRLAQLDRLWYPDLGLRNVLEIMSRRIRSAATRADDPPRSPSLES